MTDSNAAFDPRSRFAIEACLGTGGSGVVYRAHDAVRGTTVAIKVLSRIDPTSLLSFKAEFRSLAGIVHPNLLQLYELVARDNDWILSMELIEGGDFLQHVRPLASAEGADPVPATASTLKAHPGVALSEAFDTESVDDASSEHMKPQRKPARALGELSERRLRAGLRQLAEGLSALHRENRLHRDLKPGNVLVSQADERVVICDFGLVVEGAAELPSSGIRPARGSIPFHTQESTDGKIAGTVAYMSPEQMMGKTLTPASDWYAVGVMLYQALTTKMPFPTNVSFVEQSAAKQSPPPNPREIDASLPRDLSDLAVGLLAPVVAERLGYKDVVARLGDAPRSAAATDLSQSASNVLIGRASQLAQLQAALARARSGHATVALVSGRSGMGKSALMRHFFASVAKQSDALILSGRCHEREDLPFKVFDPLMDALSGHLLKLDASQLAELLPEGFSALARVFPVLRRLPLLLEGDGSDGSAEPADLLEQRRRAFAALRELLRRLALMRPLVLYVDDLQWGDLESGPIFTELLHQPQPPALLLVCAYRSEDEERSPMLDAVRNTHLPEAGIRAPVVIRVDPLSQIDARELAHTLLAGVPGADEAADLVTREAQGSPFFVGELASHIRGVGMADVGALCLDNVLEARLATLSDESRSMLAVVAVSGRPERRAVLTRAAALGASAFQAFHALESKRLLQSAGAGADDRVETYHDRIREKAYALLPEAERTRLHLALAEALSAGSTDDPEGLFEHYRAAGERERAGECAIRAADKAETSLAYGRSATLLAEALTLLSWTGEKRRALEERHGHALMCAGRGPEAADAFFRALSGATPAKAMELRGLATPQLLRAGLIGRALEELRGAEDVIGMRAPSTPLRAIFMLLWRRLLIRLRGRRLQPAPKTGVRTEAIQRMDMLWGIGSALSPMDQLRGTVYQAEHMLLAMRSGDPYRYARALAIESTTYATGNKDPGQLQRVIDAATEAGGACGHPHGLSAAKGTASLCRMLEGRFRDSVRMAREAQQIIRDRLHGTLAWDHAIMVLYELRTVALLGHVDQVIERVPEFLRDAEARGDIFAAVSGRTSHCCWAWLGTDQPDLALEQVRIAERRWSADGYYLQHWYTTQAFGEVALYRDDVEEAWQRMAREWKRMLVIRHKIQFTRAEILILRARLALALAKKKGDPSFLVAASKDAEALLRERAPWIRAHGRLVQASVDSFGDSERARRTLEQVEGQLEVVDMLLMAAVARYRRGQLTPGAEGAKLARSADAQMRRLGVKNPSGFLRMLAPGFPGKD
jgi:eukaryotic-like serine/threonine-protein kinase